MEAVRVVLCRIFAFVTFLLEEQDRQKDVGKNQTLNSAIFLLYFSHF